MSSSDRKNQKQDALKLVLLRNSFYRDCYRRTLLALLLLIVLNVSLAALVVYKWMHPPAPQYFASTADGRIIVIHPLSDPVVSDDVVIQWAVKSVRKAFALDYVHWRSQLQEASQNFTPYGWKWFSLALKNTNNLKTLTSLKMVSDVRVTGTPQILQKALVDKHYAWKIKMPLLLTYSSPGRSSINVPMSVTLVVVRMPVQDYPQRIAINNFIADTVKSSALTQAISGGNI